MLAVTTFLLDLRQISDFQTNEDVGDLLDQKHTLQINCQGAQRIVGTDDVGRRSCPLSRVQSGTQNAPPNIKRRINRRRSLQALRGTRELWMQCWSRRLPPRRASTGGGGSSEAQGLDQGAWTPCAARRCFLGGLAIWRRLSRSHRDATGGLYGCTSCRTPQSALLPLVHITPAFARLPWRPTRTCRLFVSVSQARGVKFLCTTSSTKVS